MAVAATGAALAGGAAGASSAGWLGGALAGGGALLGGIFGGGGGDQPDIPRYIKKAGKRAEFQPYTLRTGIGQTSGGEKGGGSPTVEIDPQLEALRQQGFSRAGGFFERAGLGLDRPVAQAQGFGRMDQLTFYLNT